MRIRFALLAAAAATVSLFAAAPASALLRPDGGWTPNLAAVQHLETKVAMPEGVRAIGTYVRYYAGVVRKGRKVIEGVYLLPALTGDMQIYPSGQVTHHFDPPGIHIVPEKSLPAVFDGGCSVVTVDFDVGSDAVTSVECNGLA